MVTESRAAVSMKSIEGHAVEVGARRADADRIMRQLAPVKYSCELGGYNGRQQTAQ